MFKKVLVICPHVGDGELGCGGTIAKFVREKKDIYYVAFSAAEKSVPYGFPKDELRKELMNACKLWGIRDSNVKVYHYEVRTFPQHRQDILDDIIKLRSKINPDLVFTPSTYDLHQDHQTITNEVLRAFKNNNASILGYEQPWNNITFKTNMFVGLSEDDMEKKVQILKEYKTQAKRKYLSEEFLKGLAITRGVQVGVKYAEAFEVIKWFVK